MKVLMLILSNDDNNLYSILEKIKRIYIHNYSEIDAYFYKANPNLDTEYKIVDDIIYVKTEETYPELWVKLKLVLKVFENNLSDYDFICRPNLSTFIILDRYLKHLESLPRDNCCSGIKFFGGQPIPFPSGYLFTITPDIAKHIINSNIETGIDDRCVGVVLKNLGINITEIPFIAVERSDNSTLYHLNKQLDENQNIFLIRIRHFVYDCQFGTDTSDRFEKDLIIHNFLLDKYYNIFI